MNLKKINAWATGIVAIMLLALSAGAFRLSYDVVRKEAILYGVEPSLAWIVPVLYDIGIFVAGLFVIWASINHRNKLVKLGYTIMVAITALSVYLNMSHAKAFEILPILYMITPPILLATMTFLVERMLEVVLSGVDATDILKVTLQKLQGKNEELESTLQTTTSNYEDKLRQLQDTLQLERVRLQQLQSDYDKVAETIKLLPYLREEVFLLAKVAANMMSLDEAYQRQSIYKRKTGFMDFAGKVLINGDEHV